jgi:site-specific DNA-methyltransferase (adenine-specific)
MTGILHIVVARKPIEGTIVENCLQWGCGAINVDGCRVEAHGERTGGNGYWGLAESKGWNKNSVPYRGESRERTDRGRWPANLILEDREEVEELFPDTPGQQRDTGPQFVRQANVYGEFNHVSTHLARHDSGSASRFFFNFTEQESDE